MKKEARNARLFFGILIAIVILVFLIPKLMPVAQYDKPITHSIYYVKRASNMRAEPNTKCEVVKEIPFDTKVFCERSDDSKWFVVYENETDTLYNYLEINGKELFDSSSAVIVGYIYTDLLDKYSSITREEIRLENLNKTGIWKIKYYVDDFGEPIKNKYIAAGVSGLFSNTATQNSRLNIDFLIDGKSEIAIMLYEYGRNNPVKGHRKYPDYYCVYLQDKNKKRFKLRATNTSDRLVFSRSDARKIHNALIKGGKIKFVINEKERLSTEYKFSISDAFGYKNAYRMLFE